TLLALLSTLLTLLSGLLALLTLLATLLTLLAALLALLTVLLTLLSALLTRLAALQRLLSALALFALLSALCAHPLQLLPEPLHLIQGLLGEFVPLAFLAVFAALPEHLLHFLELVAEIVDPARDGRFGHHAVLPDAAPDPVRVPLHVARQFGLLHLAESFAH